MAATPNENNQPSGHQEMPDEFWKELSEKTGLAFPLPKKSHSRMGNILPKRAKPEPEARVTKGRVGGSKLRQPKQQRKSGVKLRVESVPVQEDPFARKPRGGVSKMREEVPVVLEQLPGRKTTVVLKDRDGQSSVKSFREEDEISTQRTTAPQVTDLRNPVPKPKPEPGTLQRQHQGEGIIRIPGQIDPKNPNLRTDPVHQEFGRDWEHEKKWTPDWIRHHSYNDDDRIRYGRLMDLERTPNLDGKGHGKIRYGLDDNPYFTTDTGHYWKGQEKEPFMNIAEELAKKHVPDAKSWADIEGGPFFLTRFEGNRTLCYSYKIRRWWKPNLEGVKLLHTDRMLHDIRADQFDVSFVLHLTKKYPVDLDCLFAATRLAVVLVYPYDWQHGTPDQIGVNEEWLGATTRRQPTEHQVVEGSTRRGVVIYKL